MRRYVSNSTEIIFKYIVSGQPGEDRDWEGWLVWDKVRARQRSMYYDVYVEGQQGAIRGPWNDYNGIGLQSPG